MKVEQIGIRNLRFNVFVAAHIAMQLTNLSNLKKKISIWATFACCVSVA